MTRASLRKRVLLIDDDLAHLNILQAYLSQDYEVSTVTSGLAAIELCGRSSFDLLIVDVNMPGMDGLKAYYQIKSMAHLQHTPALFISGHNEIDNKLMAFDLGAKDYLLKPVQLPELKARIKVHLEDGESQLTVASNTIIEGPGFHFHTGENRVFLSDSQQFVDLTKIECGILRILMENPHKVISREVILQSVWGSELNVLPRTVDAHIKKIRKKLGNYAELINSIHGVGYRYSPDMASSQQAA